MVDLIFEAVDVLLSRNWACCVVLCWSAFHLIGYLFCLVVSESVRVVLIEIIVWNWNLVVVDWWVGVVWSGSIVSWTSSIVSWSCGIVSWSCSIDWSSYFSNGGYFVHEWFTVNDLWRIIFGKLYGIWQSNGL